MTVVVVLLVTVVVVVAAVVAVAMFCFHFLYLIACSLVLMAETAVCQLSCHLYITSSAHFKNCCSS
jgi:hypothetical protein